MSQIIRKKFERLTLTVELEKKKLQKQCLKRILHNLRRKSKIMN